MARLKRKRDKAREKKYGRHSPAGYRYLQEEKRKTKPVYFKNIRTKTTETRLREAGLSEEDLRSIGMGRKRIRRKR